MSFAVVWRWWSCWLAGKTLFFKVLGTVPPTLEASGDGPPAASKPAR